MGSVNLVVSNVVLLRESDKAWLLRVPIRGSMDSKEFSFTEADVWFPRSQCSFEDGVLVLPSWLAEKKETEIADERGYSVVGILGSGGYGSEEE